MVGSTALVALGLVFPQSARAAGTTYYVDNTNTSCSDTGSGTTPGAPFCTIGQGAKVAQAGDTVSVLAGTYAETVNPPRDGTGPSTEITFTAASGVTVTGSPAGTGSAGRGFSVIHNYITINGFTISGTASYGIYVSGPTGVTITNNHVTGSGSGQPTTSPGIYLQATTSCDVIGNTSDHNTNSGIVLASTSTTVGTGTLVASNTTFANAGSGIDMRGVTANYVVNNLSYGNSASGVAASANSSNSTLSNNIVHNNTQHGIEILGSPSFVMASNDAYNNGTAGINVEGTSPGATLENNISVDNGIGGATSGNIRVDASSETGTTLDYDLVDLIRGGTVELIWGGAGYSSLAAFQTATGQEPHGIQGDPMWAAAGSGDFSLTEGSPAIDSADSAARGEADGDFFGQPRVDDPATPNTGSGPRAYDDRGAVEFQAPADNPPTAALSVTPASGTAPLDVSADASGSSDDHGIVSYAFDWGDGATTPAQPGATAGHSYSGAGDYTVTVTVTDTAGQTSTATQPVHVTAAADNPPTAALSVTPASGTVALTVSADASGSSDDHGIVSYAFDWGDGNSTAAQASPTAKHVFRRSGVFTVTVTVTDTAGQTGTASQQVNVGPAVNLIANPGFETDLSGWAGLNPDSALARVKSGKNSQWKAAVSNTATGPATCGLTDSPDWVTSTTAGPYTAVLWVKAPTAGAQLTLQLRVLSGSKVARTVVKTVTLSTTWQKVVVHAKAVAAGKDLDLNAFVTGAAHGVCFYADNASLTHS